MTRKTTSPPGNIVQKPDGRILARVPVGPNNRRTFALPRALTAEQARERSGIMKALAARLLDERIASDLVNRILVDVAAAKDEKALDVALVTAEAVASGKRRPPPAPTGPTFKDIGQRWTSGQLTQDFPDFVKKKASAAEDAYRLARHVYPVAGDVPVATFGLEDALRVMRKIPAARSAATRRQVGQLMHRILAMAVFPLRLREANPLPEGFLPKPGPRKAQAYVYPAEDRTLLGCTTIPLCWRILYGFLHREGMRAGEALALRFREVDRTRGAVRLDTNKTGDARAWSLSPGVAEALEAWRVLRGAGEADLVFVHQRGGEIRDNHLADRYREHLRAAGIDRAELFERGPHRRHVTFHATRAAMVTVALAAGESEWRVTDKTGHKDASQIARYRRQARTAAELNLGAFAPLLAAIPELAGETPSGSGAGSSGPPTPPTGANVGTGEAASCGETRRAPEAAAFRFQWGNSCKGSSPFLRTADHRGIG